MLSAAIAAVDEAHEEAGSVSAPTGLSGMERIFCEVFVANGGKGTEAAIAAGYAADSAHVAACRLLCRKRVADYLTIMAMRFAHAALPVAIKVLVDIASDPEALRKDRIKAATCLMEHGGMAAPKGGVQVNVGVAVNGQQAQQLISSVWDAKQRRLSDIPPAMPDTLEQLSADVEALASPALEATQGGDHLQGPAPAAGSLPAHSSAKPPETVISCECPLCRDVPAPVDDGFEAFRKAFDDE